MHRIGPFLRSLALAIPILLGWPLTLAFPTPLVNAATAPAVNPCKLLNDSELRKVFAEITPGKIDRRLEAHGILSCIWDHAGGQFRVQVYEGEQGTIEEEIQGMSLMFLDPLTPDAAKHVRYETMTDVADQARAIVEPKDDTKGILTDSAILLAQRKGLQLTLMSTELAKRDRAAALNALEELGRAAGKRL